MINGNAATLMEKLDSFEKQMILWALQSSKNVTQAAELLKISKQRLHYKIDKHGIEWKAEVLKTVPVNQNELFQQQFDGSHSLVELLENYEKQLILHALKLSINAKAAADHLGISKQALNYKLNKYKIKEK